MSSIRAEGALTLILRVSAPPREQKIDFTRRRGDAEEVRR